MARAAGLLALLLASAQAWSIGTDAGASVQNTATVSFSVGGTPQTPVDSNTVVTVVDELVDVVVVDDSGGNIAVATPQSDAILQFTVTNNGNGSETFRVIADDNVAEGGFDPVLNQLYIESNGLPGLQIGGDTAYVPGTSDPVIAEDASIVVYVTANIPGGLGPGDDGDISLRAVSTTLIGQEGLDDPTLPAWPTPGTSYAGLGDGGGALVLGTSHDVNNLLLQSTGRYEVANAVVSVVKTAVAVVDPFGGTTVVPGSIISYRIEVTVTGAGNAEQLVVNDPLPAELEYQAGTLQIDGAPEDDDFAPSGVDVSGVNTGATDTVVVDRGTVVGGSAPIVITFDAEVR